MPLVSDPNQRAALYPKVQPLLDGPPKELASADAAGKPIVGRYVRVELPGRSRTLTLAEVEVFSEGRNVARQGKASQSSTGFDGAASRGIDGNTSGEYSRGGQTHTQENLPNPWWQVDLGAEFPIESIAIYNRTDEHFGDRLQGFTLQVLDSTGKTAFEKRDLPAPTPKSVFSVGGGAADMLLRRAAMTALVSVRGQETATFKALERFIGDDTDRQPAIQAIARIPVNYWPKEDARPLLEKLLVYIRTVPVRERTSSDALDALEMANSLAALLPRDDAKVVRKEIGSLGVRIVRLCTVADQMLFDKERIVVQAGKPAEIIFENTDIMPHNLVVGRPGSLADLGALADTTGTQPGALDRQYVPNSPAMILFSSQLLMPRNSQKIDFTAPAQPGVYPYVCTFPGHWRRMHGAMYVVADLDEYLADSEAYLAKNPLKIADELLKYNRPRTEWKLAELAPLVKEMDHGRSFTNGKQLFTVANCIACHKLNGVGTVVGPDLAQLDPKKQQVDVLRDVLEPSYEINPEVPDLCLDARRWPRGDRLDHRGDARYGEGDGESAGEMRAAGSGGVEHRRAPQGAEVDHAGGAAKPAHTGGNPRSGRLRRRARRRWAQAIPRLGRHVREAVVFREGYRHAQSHRPRNGPNLRRRHPPRFSAGRLARGDRASRSPTCLPSKPRAPSRRGTTSGRSS